MGLNSEMNAVINVISSLLMITLATANSCSPKSSLLKNGLFSPGFCGEMYFSEEDVSIRGLAISPNNTILALDRDSSNIIELTDLDNDGTYDIFETIIEFTGLTHGLASYNNFIYASSRTSVYRWNYSLIHNANDAELVVFNMSDLGHQTRTLRFNHLGELYISIGSRGNVDPTSIRSRIRRFNFSIHHNIPDEGYDFWEGEVFADGLRNEVGLAFDKFNILWGVENSGDELYRKNLGGDIHNDNPAEELNRFSNENIGKSWGYPYCFTEYNLDGGLGKGTIWAWPSFMNDGIHNDSWCRNQTISPEVSMQAHSAPLGINFFQYKNTNELPKGCNGSLGIDHDGDAFIAFHGSWNRNPATGYKVVRIQFDSETGRAISEPIDVMWHSDDDGSAAWSSGLRPVDIEFDICNRLIVSSDGDGAGGIVIIYNNSVSSPSSNINNTVLLFNNHTHTNNQTSSQDNYTISPQTLQSNENNENNVSQFITAVSVMFGVLIAVVMGLALHARTRTRQEEVNSNKEEVACMTHSSNHHVMQYQQQQRLIEMTTKTLLTSTLSSNENT